MSRVIDPDVREIFDTDIADLTPFIEISTLIVDELIGVYETEYLVEIEKWLTAHFATALDREPTKIKIGSSEDSYNWNTGDGLSASEYGKRLTIMDFEGALQDLMASKPKIIVETMLELPTDV